MSSPHRRLRHARARAYGNTLAKIEAQSGAREADYQFHRVLDALYLQSHLRHLVQRAVRNNIGDGSARISDAR